MRDMGNLKAATNDCAYALFEQISGAIQVVWVTDSGTGCTIENRSVLKTVYKTLAIFIYLLRETELLFEVCYTRFKFTFVFSLFLKPLFMS